MKNTSKHNNGVRKDKEEKLKDLMMKVCYLDPRFWDRNYHPETYLIHVSSMSEEQLNRRIFQSEKTIQRLVGRTQK